MDKPCVRAVCGSYRRNWKIQVLRWPGIWWTVHSDYMEPKEAQAMVDRYYENRGWGIIYPSTHNPGVRHGGD